MSTSSYKRLTWGNEPILTGKLQTMVDNTDFVYAHMPNVKYTRAGVNRESGVKILAGAIHVPKKHAANKKRDVYFGSFFSAGCFPIIIASVNAAPQSRYIVNTRNLDDTWLPDNRGFKAVISTNELTKKNNYMHFGVMLTYIAVGW